MRSLFVAALAGLVGVATLTGFEPAAQPVAEPAILAVSVSPEPVKLGQPLTATVLTTPDVVSVQCHVVTFNFNLPKTADGTFSGTTKVPRWARLFHGNFKAKFVAKNAAGQQTQVEQSVKI
jgi:hypothetical protein